MRWRSHSSVDQKENWIGSTFYYKSLIAKGSDSFYQEMFYVKWASGKHSWESADDLVEYGPLIAQFKQSKDNKSRIHNSRLQEQHNIHSQRATQIRPPIEGARFPVVKGLSSWSYISNNIQRTKSVIIGTNCIKRTNQRQNHNQPPTLLPLIITTIHGLLLQLLLQLSPSPLLLTTWLFFGVKNDIHVKFL